MNKAIIGTKLGMSQIFTPEGKVIPVTIVLAEPNTVVQVKNNEIDGYEAVKIGYGAVKEKNVNKPNQGQFKKAKVTPNRIMKEFRFDNSKDYKMGDKILCTTFKEGDIVDVTGMTKGRGFTGTVQRWNTHIGPKSHGSGYHRGVGSMGSTASPGRVFKNKKMPGQYGNEQVTIQNLAIVRVDAERNLIFVKGGIPGPKKGLLIVKEAVKKG